MAVVDSNTGKMLATPAIGDGPDAAGWDATHKLAFASCGEGILSVIDAGRPAIPTIETLPTQRGARTMAYDAATDRVYLVTAEFGPRPAATAENPRPRPPIVPGSFTVLVVGRWTFHPSQLVTRYPLASSRILLVAALRLRRLQMAAVDGGKATAARPA